MHVQLCCQLCSSGEGEIGRRSAGWLAEACWMQLGGQIPCTLHIPDSCRPPLGGQASQVSAEHDTCGSRMSRLACLSGCTRMLPQCAFRHTFRLPLV